MNVINLRDHPSIMDIPSQLRALADRIEAGEQDAEACYTILVLPDQFEPTFFGWGKVADRYGLAGVFALCTRLVLTDVRT